MAARFAVCSRDLAAGKAGPDRARSLDRSPTRGLGAAQEARSVERSDVRKAACEARRGQDSHPLRSSRPQTQGGKWSLSWVQPEAEGSPVGSLYRRSPSGQAVVGAGPGPPHGAAALGLGVCVAEVARLLGHLR